KALRPQGLRRETARKPVPFPRRALSSRGGHLGNPACAVPASDDLLAARLGGEQVFLVHPGESFVALSSKSAPDDQFAGHVPALLQVALAEHYLESLVAWYSRAKSLFESGSRLGRARDITWWPRTSSARGEARK